MRNAFVSALYDLAKDNPEILALVADNGAIVYDRFRQDFPGRFLNFGIAEANMVAVAAGLSACGKIPFCYTISSFLTMRAYEQIRNDVCLQMMNVKLAGIGAGFVYSNLGPTHHAVEDMAIMRCLPGMSVFSPADPLEARYATLAAAQIKGPVYLRLSTSNTPRIYRQDYDFLPGRAVVLREGGDLVIIATGAIVYDCLQAIVELEKDGVSAALLNIHTIKPLDRAAILKYADRAGAVLTVEEHSVIGGLGSAVAEALAEGAQQPVRLKRMGLEDAFADGYGSYAELKRMNKLCQADIVGQAKALLRLKDGKVIRGTYSAA